MAMAGSTAAQQQPLKETPVVEQAAVGVSIGSGARALGMGGAFIAVADDGTAAGWNPAGLAVLEKPEISFVFKGFEHQQSDHAPTELRTTTTFQPLPGSGDVPSRTDGVTTSVGGQEAATAQGLDFISAAVPLQLGRMKLVPQVSYQRAIEMGYRTQQAGPFISSGTGSTVGGQFEGESFWDSVDVSGTSAEGGIDLWSLSVGIALHQRAWVGITANLWRNGVVETFQDQSGSSFCSAGVACSLGTSKGNGSGRESFHGHNFHMGVLFRPWRQWRVGLVYKTSFNMERESLASDRSEDQEQRVVFDFQSQASSRIQWPSTWGTGVAFQPTELLTVSADYTRSRWSRARESLHATDVTYIALPDANFAEQVKSERDSHGFYPTGFTPGEPLPPGGIDPNRSRRQQDAWQARLGLEYVLRRGRILVPLRAGAFVDRQYVTDGAGNDVHFWGWSVGTGATWGHLSIDMAFVSQAGAYNIDFTFQGSSYSLEGVSGTFQDTAVQRSTRDDKYRQNRLYASAIVRF
jgi:long-subunit fatty acid transport protein